MATAEEAAGYDSMDHSAVNEQFVADYFECLEKHGLSAAGPPSLIVDLGTGTAQIPIRLSQSMASRTVVLACDLSVAMLRTAGQNICRAECSTTVIPAFCNSRQLPLRDQSCFRIISNSLIHHVPDPVEVFREIRRVAAPGAVVFVRDLLRPADSALVDRLVKRWAGYATAHQQEMFRKSLWAALTLSEAWESVSSAGFDRGCVEQTSDRHWTMACGL